VAKKKVDVKTYAYGALPPTDPAQRAWCLAELRRANLYRNNLVALRRHERERALIARRDPELGATRDWADSLHARVQETERALRGAAGLGWGTYLLVEDQVKRARKSRGEMSFRKHDGTGRLGAAVPTARADKARTDACPHVRIAPPDRRGRTVAQLVMSRNVTIELPIVLHRPLPPGTLLQGYVTVSRIGTRYVWGLRVVVEPDVVALRRIDAAPDSRATINFGWRRVGDGIRVAYAVGADGRELELVIPSILLDRYRHAEGLRSLADGAAQDYLGDARRRTRARRAGLAHPAPLVPNTRRPPWENSRHWALQDRHLYQWECDERAHAIRSRRAIVLAWVQALAREYRWLTIERFSIAELIRQEGPMEIPEARHVRFMVAPGELRMLLTREYGDDHVTFAPIEARTMICHACGGPLTGDRVRDIELYCERCDAHHDQDANNARNLHVPRAAE